MTSSPGPFSTGIDSPVNMASSTAERPSSTTPSTGIFSPGRTTTTSPARTDSTGTSSSTSPADNARSLGLKPHQLLHGVGGLPLGPGLEEAAKQDKTDDDHRRLVVDGGLETGAGDALEEARKERHRRRIQVRDRGAHGDQRVHVGGAVPGRRPRPPVELTARPHLHGRGKSEHHEPQLALRQKRRAGRTPAASATPPRPDSRSSCVA